MRVESDSESEKEISKSTTIGGTKSQPILYAKPMLHGAGGCTWTGERYQQVRELRYLGYALRVDCKDHWAKVCTLLGYA